MRSERARLRLARSRLRVKAERWGPKEGAPECAALDEKRRFAWKAGARYLARYWAGDVAGERLCRPSRLTCARPCGTLALSNPEDEGLCEGFGLQRWL
jgi:hypothetical protein